MMDKLLANIFCDGVVLQRDRPNKIWGWRNGGEKPVVVRLMRDEKKPMSSSIPEDTKVTMIDKNGRWEIEVPPHPAGGPYLLEVSTENANQMVKDIYFGEVWICGGQSNMELPMSRVERMFPKEVSKGDNPLIRQFSVALDYDFNGPVSDVNPSSWEKVNSKNIGSFSATGYFFAKKLYKELQVPIGLVMAAVGGTPVEAWMSEEMLEGFSDSIALLETCREEGYVDGVKSSEEKQSNQWFEKVNDLDIGLVEKWGEPEFSDDLWRTIPLDFPWDEKEELKGSGVVWFRYQVDVPEELAYKSASLMLGCIVDADVVYVNGEKVGSTDYRYPPRDYLVTNLKAGPNTIAIRITVTQGLGGFIKNKPYKLLWEGIEDSFNGEREIPLDGIWKYKRSVTCRDAPGITYFQYKPTGTYNSMIAPLSDFGIQGVIWYQGESNTGAPQGYEKKFGRMVEGWRNKFNQGEFPFLFVQLANYSPKGGRLNWAVLRDEQRKANLSIPNTSMVVSYDVGEEYDLHPLNKKAIGDRLALAGLRKAYGFNIVASGPVVKGIGKKGDTIVLSFDYVGEGLTIGNKGSFSSNHEDLGGFSMWIKEVEMPLQATLNKNQVILKGWKLKEATAISYAWADHPESANLLNGEGLPAHPFIFEV